MSLSSSRLIRSSSRLARRASMSSPIARLTLEKAKARLPLSVDIMLLIQPRNSASRDSGMPIIFMKTVTGSGSATALRNSPRPSGASVVIRSVASARMPASMRLISLGAKTFISGMRYTPWRGGFIDCGPKCGSPPSSMGGIMTIGPSPAASVLLENSSGSRAAWNNSSWSLMNQ